MPERHLGEFFLAGKKQVVPYRKTGSFAVIGGDVVLPLPSPSQKAKGGEEGLSLTGGTVAGLFPNRTVPYVIAPGFQNLAVFQQVVAEWHQKTVLRFVPRTTEATYIIVTNVPKPGTDLSGTCGYSEGIGVLQHGQPQSVFVNNDPARCNAYLVISHELGHAVGLVHEHQRPDRDLHLNMFPANMDAATLANTGKLIWPQIMGAYDPSSLMHYCSLCGSKVPGSPVFLTKSGGVIPQNFHLSAGDVAGINALYSEARCEIDMSECTNDAIGRGGTGRVIFKDMFPGANVDATRCSQRAKEFSDWCANKKDAFTFASFVEGGATKRLGTWNAPHIGCAIRLPTCQNGATAPTNFLGDAYQGSNTNQERCLARAKEYSDWCRNPEGAVTTATFYSPSLVLPAMRHFQAPHRGCMVETQHACVRGPTLANKRFPDAHDGADVNATRCMARAHEYSDYCVAPENALTLAAFYDGVVSRSTSFRAPHRGCSLRAQVCRKNADGTGLGKAHPLTVPQGASAEACRAEAKALFESCQNALGDLVTGTFYRAGGTPTPISYGAGVPGCSITIGSCPANPTRSNLRFQDTLGGAEASAEVCFANARAYHGACKKPFSQKVVATFVPNAGDAVVSNEAWEAR